MTLPETARTAPDAEPGSVASDVEERGPTSETRRRRVRAAVRIASVVIGGCAGLAAAVVLLRDSPVIQVLLRDEIRSDAGLSGYPKSGTGGLAPSGTRPGAGPLRNEPVLSPQDPGMTDLAGRMRPVSGTDPAPQGAGAPGAGSARARGYPGPHDVLPASPALAGTGRVDATRAGALPGDAAHAVAPAHGGVSHGAVSSGLPPRSTGPGDPSAGHVTAGQGAQEGAGPQFPDTPATGSPRPLLPADYLAADTTATGHDSDAARPGPARSGIADSTGPGRSPATPGAAGERLTASVRIGGGALIEDLEAMQVRAFRLRLLLEENTLRARICETSKPAFRPAWCVERAPAAGPAPPAAPQASSGPPRRLADPPPELLGVAGSPRRLVATVRLAGRNHDVREGDRAGPWRVNRIEPDGVVTLSTLGGRRLDLRVGG